MPSNKSVKLEQLRAPGTRRVFEAVRMLGQEMPEFEEDDTLPKMPPGVLMKGRQGGGGWQQE